MSPARSFPPLSGNPAPCAVPVSSWLSLRAVRPVFLQTGVRTLYTVYAEGPRPRGPRAPCIRARTRHTWRGRVPSGGPAATGGGGRRPPPPPPTTQTRAPLGAGRKAERARQNATPGPRTQKQTGTPAGRKIIITGWAATQRQRRRARHRPAPRKGEGPNTSPHHSGLGKRDAPATSRPARKGPDRPTNPPRAVLGGGAEDTGPAKGTRLAPATRGATPRPGRKEQPEEGKIPSARGGADRPPATTPTISTDGAAVYFASAPLGGADSRPPTGDATTAAAYERSEFART